MEVWCKKKHNKVETLQTGTNAKVLAVSSNEDVLVVGTSDGKIQVKLSFSFLLLEKFSFRICVQSTRDVYNKCISIYIYI